MARTRMSHEQAFKLYELLKADEEYFASEGLDIGHIVMWCGEKLPFAVTADQVSRGLDIIGATYKPSGMKKTKNVSQERMDAMQKQLDSLTEAVKLLVGERSASTLAGPDSLYVEKGMPQDVLED